MSFIRSNPNPQGAEVGDCTVRALCNAEGITWEQAFLTLCVQSFMMADMPSSNNVFGSYLIEHGYKYHAIAESFPLSYTVADFCEKHKNGVFILGTGTHVVCVKDGNYIDSWDSGNKIPIYYFER